MISLIYLFSKPHSKPHSPSFKLWKVLIDGLNMFVIDTGGPLYIDE